jgi:hypothetical protein
VSEENKALVRRFVEECINKANPDAADELFAADFVGHYPELPDVVRQRIEAAGGKREKG